MNCLHISFFTKRKIKKNKAKLHSDLKQTKNQNALINSALQFLSHYVKSLSLSIDSIGPQLNLILLLPLFLLTITVAKSLNKGSAKEKSNSITS